MQYILYLPVKYETVLNFWQLFTWFLRLNRRYVKHFLMWQFVASSSCNYKQAWSRVNLAVVRYKQNFSNKTSAEGVSHK